MNPYSTLPATAFWRPSVADRSLFDIEELWKPKFEVMPQDPVVTFGSCFAQHIGRALREREFSWLITEPAAPGMKQQTAREFNYGVFSCRTGNIYTASLLRQWASWATGAKAQPEEVWESEGRIFDPFRPAVEPNGFASVEEMRQSRETAIDAFRNCIERCRYFVFTLGLTESWHNSEHGYEYPMCPGTVAGEFDEQVHKFENQDFARVLTSLNEAVAAMRSLNNKLRVILTVSPVPLTATYSGRHVLVATMHSKSILRAVAGQVSTNSPFIDYFPSYEIINSPAFRGAFFEPNLRNVHPSGVSFVMDQFFNALAGKTGKATPSKSTPAKRAGNRSAEVCEEALLEAFG